MVGPGELAGEPDGEARESQTDEGQDPEGLATMLAGTSDMTWNTPNNRIRVTWDTTVEINETEAYLISFTLDGWAMICRVRAYSD
jgi:hypothetical protein